MKVQVAANVLKLLDMPKSLFEKFLLSDEATGKHAQPLFGCAPAGESLLSTVLRPCLAYKFRHCMWMHSGGTILISNKLYSIVSLFLYKMHKIQFTCTLSVEIFANLHSLIKELQENSI